MQTLIHFQIRLAKSIVVNPRSNSTRYWELGIWEHYTTHIFTRYAIKTKSMWPFKQSWWDWLHLLLCTSPWLLDCTNQRKYHMNAAEYIVKYFSFVILWLSIRYYDMGLDCSSAGKLIICNTMFGVNYSFRMVISPDNNVHVANMGSTSVLSAPDGPHVGPINLAIRVRVTRLL